MNLETLLNNLRVEYVQNLPERIQAIKEQFAAGQVSLLEETFHRLRGTGKTYGVPEVSLIAEVGESICHNKEPRLPQVVPVLIELLQECYQRQSKKESFDVARDPRFSSL